MASRVCATAIRALINLCDVLTYTPAVPIKSDKSLMVRIKLS